MIHSKLLQLVGYMEHHPEAEQGVLIVVDPVRLRRGALPARQNSRGCTGSWPPRCASASTRSPCGPTPATCRNGCATSPPTRASISAATPTTASRAGRPRPSSDLGDDLDLVEAATELWRIDQQRKAAKATLSALDSERQTVLDELDEHVPAGKHRSAVSSSPARSCSAGRR